MDEHHFSALEKAILRFKLIKDRMKLYYFVCNRLRTVKKIIRWFDYFWVDSDGEDHVPIALVYSIKAFLISLYTIKAFAFICILAYCVAFKPWLAGVLCVSGVIMMPLIIKLLEVRPIEEDDYRSRNY